MASFGDEGVVAGGHFTGDDSSANQPPMWRCGVRR
jgi:hypothetical protein